MSKEMSFFRADLSEFGIELNEKQEKQFMDYYELLIKWSSVMNLTAITDFEDVLKKHFTDSLSVIKAVPDIGEKEYSMIDIGTGAGFPGIPLKIVFPQLRITLIDSLNKRVQFLNEVIEELGLENIEAIHGRAEDLAKPDQLRECFDLAVSRAVANLSTLSEYCLPFVKVQGLFISFKAEKALEECEKAKKAIEKLGGELEKQVEFLLPNSQIYRNLLVVKKVKATPKGFPRKAGVPSKEPI